MISGASERGGGLGYSLHLAAATSYRESHTPIEGERGWGQPSTYRILWREPTYTL